MEETTSTPTSPSSASLKQRLKYKYIACLHSSFRKNITHRASAGPPPSSGVHNDSDDSNTIPKQPILNRTFSIDKCKSFITRIGRNAQGLAHGHLPSDGNGHGNGNGHGRGHRRRHSLSSDFRYDATSYALNFDEGNNDSVENEYRLRSFSSRLPQSPKREIACG
ncbi:uncharacterized protein LOC126675115 [Mercurialis annua]|uniref:uncharacterized protein LOC126675115 n=1 Tax=Mercurialis annua TaxID=3986 RepID=UPI00215EF6D2|nr:uncharacterized protein LOC126675115 [Mercurialis annua]